ncbi:MAG: glycine--tRNA ligase subunit beta, partial [Myxococcota bacterium]|nr:glycine--tRNA ligase subunit beta [Myxococcota bacterium]
LEVRCEELPARFAEPARKVLADRILGLLGSLSHGEVRTWVTPRRVAIAIADVQTERPVEDKLVTGPPAAAAFRDGEPTPAAIGFARGKGVDVADLQVVDGPRGQVVAARVRTGGEKTIELVAAGLETALLSMTFPKTMRWGSSPRRWARPIHGVVALLDGERIPATVSGLETTNTTVGHRLCPDPVPVRDAEDWLKAMEEHRVTCDVGLRRRRIVDQLEAAARQVDAQVPDMPDLVDEVTHLVEWPQVVTCQFDEDLLELPPRLLVESMKVHQRVFPLTRNGELTHHFLAVTNNPFGDPATIAAGNARVLAARFYDARHFYSEDRRHRLEQHGEELEKMRWIRKAGTMADKSQRVADLAANLSSDFDAEATAARRAGELCKCDLATQMVGEFPELQGHVGRLLAIHQGETEAVAMAIEEHYHPRFSRDSLPTTNLGRTLAVADRLDTLCGCFSHGLRPKGSADPLGLRRAANGLLAILLDTQVSGQLDTLLERSPFGASPELVDFVMARLRAQFMDEAPTDIVDAVLATGDRDPSALRSRVRAMLELSSASEFGPLKTTFKRVLGLTRDHEGSDYDSGSLT